MSQQDSSVVSFLSEHAEQLRRYPLSRVIDDDIDAHARIHERDVMAAIRTEIVPRLLINHYTGHACEEILFDEAGWPTQREVRRFALMCTQADFDTCRAYADRLQAAGLSFENLCLRLLEPAARCLGNLWCADDCDFVEVTVGVSRMTEVLRAAAATQHTPLRRPAVRGRILLANTPGGHHTFGLAIVEEFFRLAGWDVEAVIDGREAAIVETARRGRFDVVGLTLSSHDLLDRLTSIIQAIRLIENGKCPPILVGGFVFADNPDLLAKCGADAIVHDARHALKQASRFLGLKR